MAINNKDLESRIKASAGTAVDNKAAEPIKTPVMSFSRENVYIGLKTVQYVDPVTGNYKDPVPKLTFSINGSFYPFPMNGKFWRAFADFTESMAQALEGIEIVDSNVNADVSYAKQMMAQFKTKN